MTLDVSDKIQSYDSRRKATYNAASPGTGRCGPSNPFNPIPPSSCKFMFLTMFIIKA